MLGWPPRYVLWYWRARKLSSVVRRLLSTCVPTGAAAAAPAADTAAALAAAAAAAASAAAAVAAPSPPPSPIDCSRIVPHGGGSPGRGLRVAYARGCWTNWYRCKSRPEGWLGES